MNLWHKIYHHAAFALSLWLVVYSRVINFIFSTFTSTSPAPMPPHDAQSTLTSTQVINGWKFTVHSWLMAMKFAKFSFAFFSVAKLSSSSRTISLIFSQIQDLIQIDCQTSRKGLELWKFIQSRKARSLLSLSLTFENEIYCFSRLPKIDFDSYQIRDKSKKFIVWLTIDSSRGLTFWFFPPESSCLRIHFDVYGAKKTMSCKVFSSVFLVIAAREKYQPFEPLLWVTFGIQIHLFSLFCELWRVFHRCVRFDVCLIILATSSTTTKKKHFIILSIR